MNESYNIKCISHTYIVLKWNDEFIVCFDNDRQYMEEIIEKLEKRTGQKFNTIRRKGDVRDFDGLRFLHGGFKKGCQLFG